MDPRTGQLIELIQDGGTLAEAAKLQGIDPELVRDAVKDGAASIIELGGPYGPDDELAPALDAMSREGMLCQEIAELLGISSGDVHRLTADADPQATTKPEDHDGRSADERLLAGLRGAAATLAEQDNTATAVEAPADPQAANGLRSAAAADPVMRHLTPDDLRAELEHFKGELRAGGLRHSTIHSYLIGSTLFVRWLAGDYAPGPGRSHRPLPVPDAQLQRPVDSRLPAAP